ncbi:MAG: hypothetical protein EXR77_11290 [Myxococcales bacterium]|nr:hypothetical protein [Myxococcales bacterium]
MRALGVGLPRLALLRPPPLYLAYCCWLGAIGVACGSSAAKPAVLDATAEAVSAEVAAVAGCAAAAVKPDNSCCPVGAAFVEGACAVVGPPECATNALSNPQDCAPRWCLASLDRKGGLCTTGAADCLAGGRSCTDAELASGAGCVAGFRPMQTGGCAPVGLGSDGTSARAPCLLYRRQRHLGSATTQRLMTSSLVHRQTQAARLVRSPILQKRAPVCL